VVQLEVCPSGLIRPRPWWPAPNRSDDEPPGALLAGAMCQRPRCAGTLVSRRSAREPPPGIGVTAFVSIQSSPRSYPRKHLRSSTVGKCRDQGWAFPGHCSPRRNATTSCLQENGGSAGRIWRLLAALCAGPTTLSEEESGCRADRCELALRAPLTACRPDHPLRRLSQRSSHAPATLGI